MTDEDWGSWDIPTSDTPASAVGRGCTVGGGNSGMNGDALENGEADWGTTTTGPTGGRGGQGGDRSCRTCSEMGHIARDCPQKATAPRACFKCHQEGHISRDCPNAGEGGGGGDIRCYRCGESGHTSRDCPSGGGGSGGERNCFRCKQPGHIGRDCPNDSGFGGNDDGEGGGQRGGDGRGDMKCFRCDEVGHVSRDCPKPNLGPDGKPRDNYQPEEVVSDDALFAERIEVGLHFEHIQKAKVEVTGTNVPSDIKDFESSDLRKTLKDNIKRAGYKAPTPIQKFGIPIIMAKRDIMGCAQTGSGKTAAFVLPILHELFLNRPDNKAGEEPQTPEALVIAPTRELAIQIQHEFVKFGSGPDTGIRSVVTYGGANAGYQAGLIKRGTNILVATPGRLAMYVNNGLIDFSKLRFLVLDEADRMLEFGFLGDVERVCAHPSMCEDRVTLLFSATFPDAIQQLARKFLKPDYVFIAVGIIGGANADVEQVVVEASYKEKEDKLLEIIKAAPKEEKILVFVGAKRSADLLASVICQYDYNATSIHGDRLQRERETALGEFKRGERNILVATNVAARGLDIPAVAHVVNYDLPAEIEEYVHRIGRTGRVGNAGRSTSFFDPNNEKDRILAPALVKVLAEAQQEVPEFLHAYAEGGGAYGGGGGGFGGKDIRHNFGGNGGGGGGGGGGAVADDDEW